MASSRHTLPLQLHGGVSICLDPDFYDVGGSGGRSVTKLRPSRGWVKSSVSNEEGTFGPRVNRASPSLLPLEEVGFHTLIVGPLSQLDTVNSFEWFPLDTVSPRTFLVVLMSRRPSPCSLHFSLCLSFPLFCLLSSSLFFDCLVHPVLLVSIPIMTRPKV